MAKRVFLKRSSVPGKLPDSKDDVSYGELLVNYAAGNEFIGLKNSDNEYARINAHPDAADVSFNVENHADSGFTGTTAEESIAQIETEILNNENVVSASLNDVNSRISEVDANIGNKVDKVDGKGLSTNDYTTDEKTKLSGIEANAQVNVISGIQRNGVDLTPDDNKKVNVIVPMVADDIVFGGEHSDSGFTGTTVLSSITQIENEIMSNEKTVSASLNDIKTKLSAIPEATVTGVTGDILSLSDKLVNATVALAYGDTETFESKKSIKLIGKDSKVLSEIDASDFIKDGMIDSVTFDEKTHTLTLTFNDDAGKTAIPVDLKSLVDTYKAGDGLTLGTDGTFSVKDEIARVGTSADTKASNTVEGAKRYADDAKATVDAYTVNGKNISETPVLKAADIDVESHSDSGFTGTTVEESISQIEAEMLNNEKTVSGALNDVNSRVSDAETAIGNKVDKVEGKSLSSNDYTDNDKAKVAAALTEHQSLADYAKKTDIPDAYTLPSATADILGGVKVGSGLSITTDGTLSYDATKGFDATAIVNKIMSGEEASGEPNYFIAALTEDEFNSIMNAVNLGENIYCTTDGTDGYQDCIVCNKTENGVAFSILNELYPYFFTIMKDGGTYNGKYTYTSWFYGSVKSSDVTYDGTHPLNSLSGKTVFNAVIEGIEQSIVDNENSVTTNLSNKVDKVDGKGLSTNDYTDEEKAKVASALQSFTETDPTVPDWAKQSTKPTYTAAEVGALPSTTKIPSKTSDLTNDSGFLTEHQQIKTIDGETIVGDGNLSTAYDISTLYQRVKNVQYGGDECYTRITTDEYNQVLNNAKLGKNIFAIYDNKVVTFTTQTETDSDGDEYIVLINNTFGSLEYAQVSDQQINIRQGYHNRFKVEKVIGTSTNETINLNPDYDYAFYYIDSDTFEGLSGLTININSANNEHRGVCEWAIQFEVPSDMTTLPTINWDSTLLWANGEVLSIEAGYTYEFDIIMTPYTASIVGQKFNTVSE